MAESILGKINYLTEEQYQNAKANGQINENEIYMTPDDETVYDRPVVLYDNSSGTQGNIVLKDSASNYSRIDILAASGGRPFTKTIYAEHLSYTPNEIALGDFWHDGTSGGGMFASFYTLNGKNLNYVTSARFYTYSGQGAIFNTTNSIGIFKVIGYKLKKQDDPNGNNSYDNTKYSTSEMVVGTWVNGKPLYRKVFTTISVNGNSSSTTAHGISNLETVARYTSHSYYNGVYRPVTYSANSTYTLCEIDKTNIYIYNTSANPYTITVIVEYTKTTD